MLVSLRRYPRRVLAVLVVAVLMLGLGVVASPASARATRPVAGSLGSGDPYYHYLGNGGYDVRHYRLRLQYAPSTHHLRGDTKIWARATTSLRSFSLDLRHDMHVAFVLVNKHRARFTHPARYAQELIITPRTPLRAGSGFTVYVRYQGTARHVVDPDGSVDGWITTDDGAIVADEPQGAPTWFPVNNTPRDKATYDVAMSVPKDRFVAGSGHYAGRRVRGNWATYRYVLTNPASSYLITATIGRFDVHTGKTPRGIPYLVAIDPRQRSATSMVLRKLPRMIGFFADTYGRYPWHQTGAIIDNADIGYALETVTRPLFDSAPSELTLAHELAHQWYGDDVTCSRWSDIWLNEGFAEFSSWLWDQHRGGTTLRQHLRNLLARPASDDATWNPPPGRPGNAANVFAGSVYDRGAGTLEALREKVGNGVFFTIMRGWLRAHRYGNATVPQFTAYAERVAHRDLTPFFTRWLYRRGKP